MLRRTATTVVLTLVVSMAIAATFAATVAWSGIYDVSARVAHPAPVAWLLHAVMRQSVARHADSGLSVPDLDDPALVMKGAAHFMSGCAPCHGAPGQIASPIARGMEPAPPPLYSAAANFPPAQLFWIVRNGVKMTAMPAWPAASRDDEIWSLVAFIKHLPDLKTDDYLRLAGATPPVQFLPGSVTPGFVVAQCARCHGADGNGRSGVFPKLAGLGAGYLAAQLAAFRDGSRSSGFMQPIAVTLSDDAIAQAAAYYAALTRAPASHQPVSAALLAEGRRLDATGDRTVRACASCHAGRDENTNPALPSLHGQTQDYLANQLRLFRSGVRAQTADAKIMARIASPMTDRQIDAVAAYLAGS